jgi:ribosomal protein RSM22 (predicted rRNA methylase)
VQLPPPVRRIIDERAEAAGFAELKRAAAEMSDAYRAHGRPRENDVTAYLVTRMPATYAAACRVLEEVRERIGPVASVLDAGAGPGAASLAARRFFPEASITMIERDAGMCEAARRFLPEAAIVPADIVRMEELPPHGLVIAAYSLGEFGRALAARLWRSARTAFVAIEPGTPRGFGLVRAVRDELLAAGASMVAPCPAGPEGASPCPLADPDWCHFAARVERSSIHRRIKGAALGYEDEKFSYVALARAPAATAAARIVRRPRQEPGLIVLETCTPGGLRTERVTRRDRDAFRAARKAEWGGKWS